MTQPLSHTRVPKAARALCQTVLERACVYELWNRADEERWQPFQLSQAEFRQGILGGTPATRLWADLVEAGLLRIIEPGRGRRPALVAVVNPTTGESVVTLEGSEGHNRGATGSQEGRNDEAEDNDQHEAIDATEDDAGSQQGHKRDARGAAYARADNNLHPPASKVETRANVLDPRSFVQQDAGPGEAEPDPVPVPAEKPSPSGRQKAQALWSELQAIRAEHQPGSRGQAATPKRLDNLVARCRDLHRADLGREDLLRALHWLYTSDRPQCRGARDTGDPLKVLLRRSHTVDYCETARDDEAGTTTTAGPEQRPRGSPQPYFDDFDDIRDEIKAEIIDFQARQGG